MPTDTTRTCVEVQTTPDGAIQGDADRTSEQGQAIRLSVDEQHRLVSVLLAPPALAPAMERAAQAHNELIEAP